MSGDVLDKDVEQRRLEVEMQKVSYCQTNKYVLKNLYNYAFLYAIQSPHMQRRERIERWRAEKKKMEDKVSSAPVVPGLAPPKKSWNLEDDEDEDDDLPAPLKKLQQQRQLGTLPLEKKMETGEKRWIPLKMMFGNVYYDCETASRCMQFC